MSPAVQKYLGAGGDLSGKLCLESWTTSGMQKWLSLGKEEGLAGMLMS